jgi:hypothetical protein
MIETDRQATGDFVTVLLTAPLLQALEQYMRDEGRDRTRSDALKDAFAEWCVTRGYIRAGDDQGT